MLDNKVLMHMALEVSKNDRGNKSLLERIFSQCSEYTSEQFESFCEQLKNYHKVNGILVGQSIRNMLSSIRNAHKEGVSIEGKTQNALNKAVKAKRKAREGTKNLIKDELDSVITELKDAFKKLDMQARVAYTQELNSLLKRVCDEIIVSKEYVVSRTPRESTLPTAIVESMAT